MVLVHPQWDPIAIQVAGLSIRWYGLCYALAILGLNAWLIKRAARFPNVPVVLYDSLLLWATIGIVLGGRIGYVLFYQPSWLVDDPWFLLQLYRPGMSFHGGLIGVSLAIIGVARYYRVPILQLGDPVASVVPWGLALGRLGNFINGELWGIPTHGHWGMIFPWVDNLPRHPAQLYQMLLEGVLLGIILYCYTLKPRRAGQTVGLFLLGYGLARSLVECVRVPDPQYGYLAWGWLTMGQLLSVPLCLMGIYLMVRRKNES